MKIKYYIIGIMLIIIDQIVKQLTINRYLTLIPNVLNITYTQNTGAAFGIGTKTIVTVISIIIIIGVIVYLIKQKDKIINYLPYVLILSGAFANLLDRLFRGYVIDYIDINFFNFPNFNIADICIVIGIIVILIKNLKFDKME